MPPLWVRAWIGDASTGGHHKVYDNELDDYLEVRVVRPADPAPAAPEFVQALHWHGSSRFVVRRADRSVVIVFEVLKLFFAAVAIAGAVVIAAEMRAQAYLAVIVERVSKEICAFRISVCCFAFCSAFIHTVLSSDSDVLEHSEIRESNSVGSWCAR